MEARNPYAKNKTDATLTDRELFADGKAILPSRQPPFAVRDGARARRGQLTDKLKRTLRQVLSNYTLPYPFPFPDDHDNLDPDNFVRHVIPRDALDWCALPSGLTTRSFAGALIELHRRGYVALGETLLLITDRMAEVHLSTLLADIPKSVVDKAMLDIQQVMRDLPAEEALALDAKDTAAESPAPSVARTPAAPAPAPAPAPRRAAPSRLAESLRASGHLVGTVPPAAAKIDHDKIDHAHKVMDTLRGVTLQVVEAGDASPGDPADGVPLEERVAKLAPEAWANVIGEPPEPLSSMPPERALAWELERLRAQVSVVYGLLPFTGEGTIDSTVEGLPTEGDMEAAVDTAQDSLRAAYGQEVEPSPRGLAG